MNKSSDTYVPTLREKMGTPPAIRDTGDPCNACLPEWSKGFAICPECGLKRPPEPKE